MLSVRLTAEEMLRVQQNASTLGVTPSDYIRSLIALPVAACDESPDTTDTRSENPFTLVLYDKKTYPQLVKQLRAWGHHYNQAVHALNIIASKKFMTQENTIELITKATGAIDGVDLLRSDLMTLIDSLAIAPHVLTERSAMKRNSKPANSHEQTAY